MFIFNFKKRKYSTILDNWLKEKKDGIKEQSYIKYHQLISNYINPILGNVNFKKISEKKIISFFDCEIINKLSASSKKTIIYIINSSTDQKFKKNIEEFFRGKNRIKQNKIKYFTKTEQKILEEYIYKHLNIKSLSILLCLYTGLRIGEVCGLKWEDIDFKNRLLTIKKTIQRIPDLNSHKIKTKLIVSIPKTDTSSRNIPIPYFLLQLLKSYKSLPNNYIITNKDRPVDPRVLSRHFERILKETKISRLSFHALRHTFATRSLEAKMDIKTLSEILGHSTYKTTLEIYAHSSIELKRESMNHLVNYVNPKNKKKP